MVTRFYYVTGTFAIIGMIFIASFCLFHKKVAPVNSEEWIKKRGPYISDFLGLSFPGQYAPMFGHDNLRTVPYVLSGEDRERAVKKLQDTFQNTQKVSVVFDDYWGKQPDIRGKESLPFKEFFLSYDQYLATELSKQTELVGETLISPLSTISAGGPDIVFTLQPSGVKFIFYSCKDMFVILVTRNSQWQGCQRWQGDFHYLETALLDARLQNGETVLSVAARESGWGLPINIRTPENGESAETD